MKMMQDLRKTLEKMQKMSTKDIILMRSMIPYYRRVVASNPFFHMTLVVATRLRRGNIYRLISYGSRCRQHQQACQPAYSYLPYHGIPSLFVTNLHKKNLFLLQLDKKVNPAHHSVTNYLPKFSFTQKEKFFHPRRENLLDREKWTDD